MTTFATLNMLRIIPLSDGIVTAAARGYTLTAISRTGERYVLRPTNGRERPRIFSTVDFAIKVAHESLKLDRLMVDLAELRKKAPGQAAQGAAGDEPKSEVQQQLEECSGQPGAAQCRA